MALLKNESSGNKTIGRTQLCPCGSGKRYKHCCGWVSSARLSNAASALEAIKTQALTMQQSGSLEAAGERYRQALDLAPDDPDCLHMLGVVLYSLARPREAAPLVRKAGADSTDRRNGLVKSFGGRFVV